MSRDGNGVALVMILVWLFWAALVIGLNIGIVYVIWHFISKFW
jgi:hypothetical protein